MIRLDQIMLIQSIELILLAVMEKFNGLSELQLTLGTDLTEKIFMGISDNVSR